MKNAKKIIALLLCAVLLVGASVAGTLAYLTSQTKTVTNTFTVGKVSLGEDEDGDGKIDDGLNEAKVNEYGEKLNSDGAVWQEGNTLAARVTENTYKLIPGHSYTKDPTIHVAAGSEKSYLYVKVANGISDIEDASNTIAAQMKANGWEVLNADEGLYYYNGSVNTDTTDLTTGVRDVPVFGSFKLKTDADVSTYSSATITVTAYAIQADGFDNATTAWNTGAPADWKN